MSLAGQGFYGPKGVGALHIRRGTRIIPFINGGIQKGGRRAGTENVAGIVGLGVAASSGSACTSQALKASHVLEAMGIDPALAQDSLLLTLGMDNTMEDVHYFLEVFPPIVRRLREISPLCNQ